MVQRKRACLLCVCTSACQFYRIINFYFNSHPLPPRPSSTYFSLSPVPPLPARLKTPLTYFSSRSTLRLPLARSHGVVLGRQENKNALRLWLGSNRRDRRDDDDDEDRNRGERRKRAKWNILLHRSATVRTALSNMSSSFFDGGTWKLQSWFINFKTVLRRISIHISRKVI